MLLHIGTLLSCRTFPGLVSIGEMWAVLFFSCSAFERLLGLGLDSVRLFHRTLLWLDTDSDSDRHKTCKHSAIFTHQSACEMSTFSIKNQFKIHTCFLGLGVSVRHGDLIRVSSWNNLVQKILCSFQVLCRKGSFLGKIDIKQCVRLNFKKHKTLKQQPYRNCM